MKIRRYERYDIPDMVKYVKAGLQLQPTYQGIRFDEDKILNLLTGNLTNKSFFCDVVEDDNGELVGGMAATVSQFPFSKEVYTADMVTYIREGHRGNLWAITGLVRAYIKWARTRGAKQIRWSQSTGFKMDKFAVLAKRLKFKQIGTHFMMETGL